MHDISWGDKRARRIEAKQYVRKFLLYPAFWIDPDKQINHKIEWKQILFKEDNFNSIPNKQGIYCFVVKPPIVNYLFETHYLFYVGKAFPSTLRSRYKKYIDEKNNKGIGKQKPRIKVQEMLNDYYEHIYFFYAELESSQIKNAEDKLLNMFMPYVNTSIPQLKISEEYKHLYQ